MRGRSSPCRKCSFPTFSLALFLVFSVVLSQSAFGATLNLTAKWTANTDPDMKEYRFYRTDASRVRIGTTPHPNTSLAFAVNVADGSAGTLLFVLTAVDINNNESGDSNVASFDYDLSKVTISGYVRDSSNVAINGVVMGGLPKDQKTDANGYYSATVPYGWSGTVTPSKDGYTFTPSSRDYSNVTSDQTGQDYRGATSEVISTPKTPSGPSSGYTGTSHKFSTGGSSSSLGASHPVEYRFDWGDGALSSWGSSSLAHIWTVAGTYLVKAQARSKRDPNNVSAWSNSSSISVQGKPFIQVTSPDGGENLVVGNPYIITWNSAYLNSEGAVHLFYSYDGAWHPITTLSPGAASLNWTVPRIPEKVTSPKPSGFVRPGSLWIGNWVNGQWECYDRNDYTFRVLYDGWLCKISGGDQGGATVMLDNGAFAGYGISLELGMFEINGAYGVDTKGKISGVYTINGFGNPGSMYHTGNVKGSIDLSSKKLTLGLTTSDGAAVFSLSGVRLPDEPVIPVQWVANLSGSASGNLTSLEIDPYQAGDELYARMFEFAGSGTLTGGGSIHMNGYFYLTSGTKNNVYGVYQIAEKAEDGVFTGSLNLSGGTINFTMTSSNGNTYTVVGQKATP
jgi:hypothetical protein